MFPNLQAGIKADKARANDWDYSHYEERAEYLERLISEYADLSARVQDWDYQEECLNVKCSALGEILECLNERLYED